MGTGFIFTWVAVGHRTGIERVLGEECWVAKVNRGRKVRWF